MDERRDEPSSLTVEGEKKKVVNQMDGIQGEDLEMKRGDMVEESRCQSSLYMHIHIPVNRTPSPKPDSSNSS
jgi:hypothetical protein